MISMFEVKWFKLFGIPEPVIFRILCKLSLVLKNSFMPKTTTQEEIIPNGNLYVMIRKILETLTNVCEFLYKFKKSIRIGFGTITLKIFFFKRISKMLLINLFWKILSIIVKA